MPPSLLPFASGAGGGPPPWGRASIFEVFHRPDQTCPVADLLEEQCLQRCFHGPATGFMLGRNLHSAGRYANGPMEKSTRASPAANPPQPSVSKRCGKVRKPNALEREGHAKRSLKHC